MTAIQRERLLLDEKKKRIVMFKVDGTFIRFDYTYIDDDEFEASLEGLASKYKINKDSIFTFTLGTQEQTEDGIVHFCPKCGSHYEYGFEPSVNMYYSIDKESNELKPAGYYKTLNIDCYTCGEVFNISTDKFEEESDKLTQDLLEKENNKTIEQNS